jgi:hypothetical protein
MDLSNQNTKHMRDSNTDNLATQSHLLQLTVWLATGQLLEQNTYAQYQ